MAEIVTKATRESFGEAITELAEKYPEIVVLDADLAAATKTEIFKKAYPNRFIDCGIAECNMIGVAAGLATCGKIPFAASFAMFSAGRAFEQIRNSVGYPHLNVKIVGSHAGISVGEDGATHQCNEDIALMRTIPGMVVLNPADHYEMKAAVEAAVKYQGPVYIRLGRLAVASVHNNDDSQFEIGKAIQLCEGTAVSYTHLDVYKRQVGDRIHQPYRSGLIEGLDSVFRMSYELGSLGTYVSGAGPTIIAMIHAGDADSFLHYASSHLEERGISGWQVLVLDTDANGASVSIE